MPVLILIVTRNGGAVAVTGSKIVALAADHHSTPVVVCASLNALTTELILKTSLQNFHAKSPDGVFQFYHGLRF